MHTVAGSVAILLAIPMTLSVATTEPPLAADNAPSGLSPVLQPVLNALDGDDVLQLVAIPTVPLFDPAAFLLTESDLEQLVESMVLLDPYIGTAIAQVVTANGSTTEILLVHADAETAASNAELVNETLANGLDPVSRRPVSELLPSAEVSAEGPIVRVSVSEPGAFRIALDMMQQRSLFPVG